MSGTKINIYKQDPSVTSLDYRTTYIHTAIQSGPKDKDIEIILNSIPQFGSPEPLIPIIKLSPEGDLLFDPINAPMSFNAVHTFAVVRQVVTMFQRCFKREKIKVDTTWQWGDTPIKIHPNAGYGKNAYYSREDKAIKFFFFFNHPTPGATISKIVEIYTCKSFDIVAHETGHAVLDLLQPHWYYPTTRSRQAKEQMGAMHESFADLTAIFTMLSQLDVCEAIIAESKANLHQKGFFSDIGEEFGQAMGKDRGLRNADNDLKVDDILDPADSHAFSNVFTGAVYDILADIFDLEKDLDLYDPARTLYWVGQKIFSAFVIAFEGAPATDATFYDVASTMTKVIGQKGRDEGKDWEPIAKKHFETRGIMNEVKLRAFKSFSSNPSLKKKNT